ncbi:hypothetical protein SAMN04488524_1034 [Pedobacter africanus]|uniref:Addiction module component n=2 Tax=Pedobacter africanus TaxID=151894 RepID=A0A1W1ZWS1_9SPHI|nr:hypothetical protein SAMN04488524_1034 [Pedobacter africanus]
MDLQTEKIELIKLLLDTEDETIIQKIRALFNAEKKDFLTELPKHVKQGLERSRKQAKDGQLIPFEQIVTELKGI